MTATVKHPGVSLTLAGVLFHFAPLTLNLLVSLLPRLEELQAAAAKGGLAELAQLIDFIGDMAHASLVRNHTDLTMEQLKSELLDGGNYLGVQQAVLAASGLVAKSEGEAVPVGG